MIRDAEVLNALTETVRRFVRERLLPAEARVEEENAIPAELIAEMRELGLFGMSIPEEYGGLGLTMEEEVLRRLRARLRLAGLSLGHRHQQRHRLAGHHRRRHRGSRSNTGCRAWRRGEIIGSFALTEPDVGSDAGSVKTTARRDGDHYVLERHQALHHQRARGRRLHRHGAHRWPRSGRCHRVPRAERQSRSEPRARSTRRWASAARAPAT